MGIVGADVMLMVAVDAALRPSELRALRRGRCDLTGSRPRLRIEEAAVDAYGHGVVFKDPKDHEYRSVLLCPSVARLLEDHLQHHVDAGEDALVFTSPEGHVLRWSNFKKQWRGAFERIGIPPMNVNMVRHTGGSILASVGIPLHEIKTFMGHASITTTEQYLQASLDMKGLTAASLTEYKERDSLGTLCRSFFEATGILVGVPTISDQRP